MRAQIFDKYNRLCSLHTELVVYSRNAFQNFLLRKFQMGTLDPCFLALSKLRRRRFDESIDICSEILGRNQYDQSAWYLKARALTNKNYIDDIEVEEQGLADFLLDDNAVSKVPRPGTSINRPGTQSLGRPGTSSINQAMRPMTGSGRPVTGFARPGTQNRPGTNSGRPGTSLRDSLMSSQGMRPGTSRPVTSSGRFVRLGTASMLVDANGPFITVERLDLRKYASRPTLARVLCDYLIYNDHNMARAMELCAYATVNCNYEDWWWKARLGKCYFHLGLLRDAEKQFSSSLKTTSVVPTHLELAKVYMRMDQPQTAIEVFRAALKRHMGEVSLLVGVARVEDMLNHVEGAVESYREVLERDSSNVESLASLAAHAFYDDQPETALRHYRRLLQMGVQGPEVWNNVGLCCFFAGQYDLCLNCFERALTLASDDSLGDTWYNLGHVALGVGDLGLAYQCFKVATSISGNHAEALTNLAVLEQRKGNDEQAYQTYLMVHKAAPHVYEAWYNAALLQFRAGEYQEANRLVQRALEEFPEHSESIELRRQLRAVLAAV